MSLVSKLKDSYFTYTDYYDLIIYSEKLGIAPNEFIKSYGYQLKRKKIKKQNRLYTSVGSICASAKIWVTDFKGALKICKYLSKGILDTIKNNYSKRK